jgi:RES domain-containing protein
MSVRRLRRALACYRIGDPGGEFPIFDATGSTIYPGRWNDQDSPVIYAAETYSAAMLEKLAHGGGEMPANQHYIEIEVPKGSSYEVVTKDSLPGWDSADCRSAKVFGVRWVDEERSLLLFVPSYVARVEKNVLINPVHPEFSSIEVSLEQPVWWDERLFPPSGQDED